MHSISEFFESFGINTKYFYAVFGVFLAIYIFIHIAPSSSEMFGYLFAVVPIFLPFAMFFLFFEAWMDYVKIEFKQKQGRVTLEIKIPQEIFKSPEAMELILIQMHQTNSPDNLVQTYIDGKHPPTYALELVSRGGDVRFYINTPRTKFKNIIETQLYAQYPGVEVHEVDIDYTAEIPWDPSKYAYMTFHYGLKKADAYPIKTYIEFGLDKMPKEEEKIDPIATVLETLGNIGPNENIWVQILISANREVGFKEGYLRKHEDWKSPARAEIKKIIENAVKRAGAESTGNVMQLLTDAEKDTIKAIERSLGKNAFNTAIRCIYLGTKEAYKPSERIGAMNSMWRAYDDLNRNSIGVRWRTDFDWPWWQDPKGRRVLHYKKEELDHYKRRKYESRSDADGEKIMTTEELATIFHFPGKVVTTPSLARIPSKRSEAPSNLPI